MTPPVEEPQLAASVLRFALDLALVATGAALIVFTMRATAPLFYMLPSTERHRVRLQRLAPVAGVALLAAYIAASLLVLVGREPRLAVAAIVLLVVLAGFAWTPLHNLLNGLAFRLEGLCWEGDRVQTGDVEGTVRVVGLRALVVQTRQGDEAVIPYASIARETFRRTQSVRGAHVHTFMVQETPYTDFAELKRAVVEAALRCHWASVVHLPVVKPLGDGAVEVSVYALDADHVDEVETAVRSLVGTR